MKKLFKNLLIYKIGAFFVAFVTYVKTRIKVSDTFYHEGFKELVKRYLGIDIKKDWIGRLYGIANPNINMKGNLDFNNTIIEIDGDNTNSTEYVKVWMHRQLRLMRELFDLSKLYDYINVEITHVGPLTHDNYLIVFDLTDRIDMAKKFKSMFWHAFTYGVIALIVLLIIL